MALKPGIFFNDDLFHAIYKAATLSPDRSVLGTQSYSFGGEILQIAANKETTLAEMTERLTAFLKEKDIIGYQVIKGETCFGDVMRIFFDTVKADKQLDWK